eukprot:scaffold7907_cov165-Skeletonema_dohrnii-CCMP3373.AAC.2
MELLRRQGGVKRKTSAAGILHTASLIELCIHQPCTNLLTVGCRHQTTKGTAKWICRQPEDIGANLCQDFALGMAIVPCNVSDTYLEIMIVLRCGNESFTLK